MTYCLLLLLTILIFIVHHTLNKKKKTITILPARKCINFALNFGDLEYSYQKKKIGNIKRFFEEP